MVGSGTGFVGEAFSLSVPQPHLWSFDDPFLYDLDVTILGGRNSDGKSVSSHSISLYKSCFVCTLT